MKPSVHGPMDFAETLKSRFGVGDLELPEREKRYVFQSRGEGSICTDVPV